MTSKQKNKYLRVILPYVVVNLLLFSTSYFWIRPLIPSLQPPIIFFINLLVSIFIVQRLNLSTMRKALFVLLASFCSSIIGFLLILSTMVLPGSREHNYVMYKVCLPAMKKHYGISESQGFPDAGQYDKDGQQKWWYQHTECEQKVWKGKGPVFSEDPPGFIPARE